MPTKAVRWHESVTDSKHDEIFNPAVTKPIQYTQRQHDPSTFSGPDEQRGAAFAKNRLNMMYSQQAGTRFVLKPIRDPDALASPKLGRAKAAPSPRRQSGSVSSNITAGKAPSKFKHQQGSSPSILVVEPIDPYHKENRSPSKAARSPRKTRKASPEREQEIDWRDLPWVPDAPDPLKMPSTPRPRRLPTPDLPPIDPWKFYPRPIMAYNDCALPPGPAALRQEVKSKILPWFPGDVPTSANCRSFAGDGVHG